MVTIDKKKYPSIYNRVIQNIQLSLRRDVCRKRFIVRWTVILSVMFLVVHYLGLLGHIHLDIKFNSPHHEHDSILEIEDVHKIKERDSNVVIVDPLKELRQKQALDNIQGGLDQPKQDNIQHQEPDPQKEPEVKKEDGLVHAFTGPTNQEPIYLDYIDKNLPWNTTAEEESKKKWKLNKYLSDRTPLNRDTHDGRHETCRQRLYQRKLPTASVVLVFYNEALSVVLRTAFTVLKESDPRLIHEVLLYDDASTNDELQGPLERHIANYPKIRLVRAKQRGGLVKARLYSSREARGDVLLYLDAHCEPTPGWLEPLLEPIAKDRRTVTLPSLDGINWENLKYAGADTIWVIGGVNWLMNMLWYPLPEREKVRREREDPFPITANLRTPTMAGGLFAMDRLYFKELGEYDEDMGVWGGENMELSFRVWMCGGNMAFVPCSKVGHIFRPAHPYDFMGDTGNVVSKNYIRAARVWFDDELDFYFKLRPHFKDIDVGDLTARHELRKRLNCKSYAWFIKNVFPELPLQSDLIGSGQFRTDNGRCMDTRGGDLSFGNKLYIGQCSDGSRPNQNSNKFMMFTKNNMLMGLNYCTDSGYSRALQFHQCHGHGGGQGFIYNKETRQITQGTGKCVTADDNSNEVVMETCESGNKAQLWTFEFKYF